LETPAAVGVPVGGVPEVTTSMFHEVDEPFSFQLNSAEVDVIAPALSEEGSGQLTSKIETSSKATPSSVTDPSEPKANLTKTLD